MSNLQPGSSIAHLREVHDLPHCDDCGFPCEELRRGYLDGHFCCLCVWRSGPIRNSFEGCEHCTARHEANLERRKTRSHATESIWKQERDMYGWNL